MRCTMQRSLLLLFFFMVACQRGDVVDAIPEPDPGIYRIPVVVHIVHHGEPVGQGYNLSEERIKSQIRVLNEDYRRKEGSRGFNNHPDGGDARIEFLLAQTAPDGGSTDGIVRVNATAIENPTNTNSLFDYYAHYSYWEPSQYLNIWTMPLPASTIDLVLGQATGPESDLPGIDLLLIGEPFQAEGVLVNAAHFGVSDIDSEYNLGRTVTHEVGHYLGLLHPWGTGDCATNDYCEDTPAVDKPFPGPFSCDGQAVMTANFMNYAPDKSVNIFTQDQISRMHHVLNHSPRRHSLLTSPGLSNTEVR